MRSRCSFEQPSSAAACSAFIRGGRAAEARLAASSALSVRRGFHTPCRTATLNISVVLVSQVNKHTSLYVSLWEERAQHTAARSLGVKRAPMTRAGWYSTRRGGGGRIRPESSCAAASSRDCGAESDGLAPYVQIARGKPRPLRCTRAGGCFASAQSFTNVQNK